jgi:carboxyl-terminal processing protease
MKYKNIKIFTWSILLLGFIISCKSTEVSPDSNTNSGSTSGSTNNNPNKDVNTWIYQEMKKYYLWTDKIPEFSKTDLTLQPGYKSGDAANLKYYFDSLLFEEGTTDRFSWIQESSTELVNSLNGINKVFGIRYSPYYLDDAQKNVGFFLTYVVKDSPAAKAGLKRGDIILTVNGTQLTVDNYTSLLSPETVTVGLGEYKNSTLSLSSKTITMTRAEVQDNPVHFSKIIEKGSKKIGYFVYSQFIPGTSSAFDNQMRQIFADFKSKGVNELVLDLRLNPGGYISSAVVLSSLIGKGVNNTQLMYRDEWNANIMSQYAASSFEKKFNTETNNIGSSLSRVFVLTSTGTASASELVINSLRPYMPVILIGDHTYGKNVGSITISDDAKRWNWGMQPITLKTYNKNGESNYGTKDGFLPDYAVKDNQIPYKPWGDESETLLSQALTIITGSPLRSNARQNTVQLSNTALPVHQGDNPMMNRKEMFTENYLK